MNRTVVAPPPPYQREDGILVCTRANGDELRLHEDRGYLHAHRWRVICGEWAAPVAYGLTRDEFLSAARALGRPAPP